MRTQWVTRSIFCPLLYIHNVHEAFSSTSKINVCHDNARTWLLIEVAFECGSYVAVDTCYTLDWSILLCWRLSGLMLSSVIKWNTYSRSAVFAYVLTGTRLHARRTSSLIHLCSFTALTYRIILVAYTCREPQTICDRQWWMMLSIFSYKWK